MERRHLLDHFYLFGGIYAGDDFVVAGRLSVAYLYDTVWGGEGTEGCGAEIDHCSPVLGDNVCGRLFSVVLSRGFEYVVSVEGGESFGSADGYGFVAGALVPSNVLFGF
ncbi:MAG: hypothetical protein LBP64_01200 [Tannerella sp.]|jgi:hypothetical protein|nr:hypothetical protein [Tannerella sp.]